MNYKTLQERIAQCKTYEQNGLPEFLKAKVRGIRRNIEFQLDRIKAETKGESIELEYAN